MTYWGTNVDSTHERVLSTPQGNISSELLRGNIPSMILYFTRDLVDGLNSRVSFLHDF